VPSPTGLEVGLLIGARDEVARRQRNGLPDAFVEI
jgi:hypothetical protein